MNTGDLIEELEGLGVQLWAESGQLRFRAPKGVMTPERLATIKAHKQELLARLGGSAAVVPDKAGRHEPFPLTDVQSAYLLGRSEAFGYGGVACHGYFEVAFAELDPARLESAWQRLVDRHDMLRAVIDPAGHQRVLPDPPPYRIGIRDVRGEPRHRFDDAIEAVRAELSHRVYDPQRWPLFELRVTRGDGRDVLHVSIDLLVADYASIQLLLAELDREYTRPGDPAKPSLEITFRDVLLAERAARQGPGYEADRSWWHERVDTLPPAPELPLAEQPEQAPPRFVRHHTRLDRARWAQLRRRATERDLSPAGALLAGYAEVIGSWSRRPGFTLNLTLLNRPPLHSQVGELVGDFTSVTLLAVEPEPGAPFAERAAALQRRLWTDLDHRRYSGVEVVRELARRRGAEAALMPVVFTSTVGLADAAADAGEFTGSGELVHGVSQTPQVWIDCQVMEHRGELLINWDVRDGVFPDGLVEDMFAAYEALIGRLATEDGAWTQPRPVVLPAAQATRRAEVNDTAAPLPRLLLHEPVLDQARRNPDRTAVIAADRTLSFAQLLAEAQAVAARLLAGGSRPAEPVGVVMDKGWEQVVAVIGVLLAGAAYLPIDTNQPPARRASMLSRAAVRHVLTQPWRSGGDWPDGLEVHAVPCGPPARQPAGPPVPAQPDDLAYVIYTSGSTGSPKGVMISHRGAVNTVLDINDRFGVTAADRVLGLANLGFDLSVYDIFGVLGAGGALVLPDPGRRGDPSHWAELAAEHGVTIWNSVPAQMQMLSDYLAGVPEEDRPSLRLALLSGDWIPVTLPDAIRALQPELKVVSLGGATEGSIWSIHHRIEKVEPGWRSIPYGVPLANQTFDVFRDDLTPCPDWVPGELYIGGTGVALGYLGDQARTAERFLTHPVTAARLYRTGDVGRYRPDGTIEFLGRQDNQVKILGHRIELAEVEAALVGFPPVGSAAVVVHGTAPLQRRLEAFVEPGHRPEPPAVGEAARRVGVVATAAAASVVARVDPAAMRAFVARLDRAALDAMLWALRQAGLFSGPHAVHGLPAVLAAARVAQRHHRLVRRWLRALAGNGLLAAEPQGWRLAPGAPVLEPDWNGVFEAAAAVGPDHGAELVRYLHTSAQRLPELLRDELDPLALLFPEGRLDVADSAYRDNLLSRYLNRALATALREIADEHGDRPLAVLEVGGGVGGTTAELIDAVAGRDVDYLFTDVSTFFLDEARQRFGAAMRYGLFDLNADPWAQGLQPNSFDVVVCANVLHNARHADEALRRLGSLLRPGGWLLFIEATRDSYPLMASMEFKEGLTEFADERQASEHTFHTRRSWLERLDAIGAELVCCLPGPDDVLASAGQHAFTARVKTDRARVEPAELAGHLAGQLPGYMLPARTHVVDALPLTGNGKVDRRALERWTCLQDEPEARTGAAPSGELEQRLAQLWTGVLGTERIGRDEDFYAAGGDSLLAAKLVGRVRDELPAAAGHSWDVLLRQLMRTPTVAGFAAWLQVAGTALPDLTALPVVGETRPGTLVDFGGTGGPGDPVLVLVHDGSGTLAPYRALVPALAGRGRVVGLTVGSAEELLQLDPDALIAKLAAGYAAELAGAVTGPYHLVGYCMGGLLAAELARNLTETGLDVAGLTVISSYRVPYLVEDDLLVEYAFARALGADPAALGYPADEAALARGLHEALAATPGRLRSGCLTRLDGDPELRAVAEGLRELSLRPPPQRLAALRRAAGERLGHESAQLAWLVFDHCLRAVTRHPAQLYAGDVTFLRQQGATHFLPGLREDMTEFWREVCLGELRVVDIPGDHFSCLHAQHAGAVAEAVWR